MRPEAAAALQAVDRQAADRIGEARRRLAAILGDLDETAAMAGLRHAGQLTVNFHPDRLAPGGTVVEGLLRDGRYRSQFSTGISNGSRSAVSGGMRSEWEREMFGGAYGTRPDGRPIYGTLDLLNDTRGGSPGFGSCHLILHPDVVDRCTLSVGDTYVGPTDVGTAAQPAPILAGLAEQAARGELLARPLDVEALRSLLDGVGRPPTTDRQLETYVEAQIHGGVDLRHDVVAVVADPAFASRDEKRHLEALADLGGADLRWHGGSVLAADDFPADFRRPDLPDMAREVARPDGMVDAAVIGDLARTIDPGPATTVGDQSDHPLQWVKHLWQALVVFGADLAD